MRRSSLRSIHAIRSHLLVGTDLGILSSHNGAELGAEARDVIIGAVFALAFSPDGELAMCAAASGVFRRDRDGWLRAEAPESAIPRGRWSPGRRTIGSICSAGAGCSRARTAAAPMRSCPDRRR